MSDILTKLENEQDVHRKRLLLVGYLCSRLAIHGTRPVLVGGNAVELYTFGDYATHDIDIVTPNRDEVSEVLEELGFEKQAGFRHWIHDGLGLYLEIPDDELAGDPNRVTEVKVDEYVAYVIGIEDLIIDRLNAYIHWRSTSDFEQAATVFMLHRDSIDFAYLQKKAEEYELERGLQELEQLRQSNALRVDD